MNNQPNINVQTISPNKFLMLFQWLFSLSKIWWFVIISLIVLFAISPNQGQATGLFMMDNIIRIIPFVLISAVLAGYLEAAGADQLIGKIFANKVWLAILFASIFGAFSPFCSCGVIPLIAALIVSGVPLSAIMAFWISSPVMDPSMFIVTSAGIGIQFAIVKTVSALGLGLMAGFSTQLLISSGMFANPSRITQISGCASKNLSFTEPNWAVWQEPNRISLLRNKSVTMILFLVKWLTFAYLLESLMMTYVPAELLSRWLGGSSILAVIYAAALGVPAYLNGFAAVPLVSGLIDNGMSQGAALSFMLSGSITSIPAGIAVYSLVRRPIFFWYLLLALIGAILAGFLFNLSLAF